MVTARSSRIHRLLVLGLVVLMGNGWHLMGEAVAQRPGGGRHQDAAAGGGAGHRHHPAALFPGPIRRDAVERVGDEDMSLKQ